MNSKIDWEILERWITDATNGDFDGHMTIMRFTTHWKVMLGTPDLDVGDGRQQVALLPAFDSLHDALMAILHFQRRHFPRD